MRPLTLKLPHTLWSAIERHQRATGEPVHHIVRASTEEFLRADLTRDRSVDLERAER